MPVNMTNMVASHMETFMQTPNTWAAVRWRADPLADATVLSIAGPWPELGDNADAATLIAPIVQRLQLATRAMAQWTNNAGLAAWRPDPSLPPDIAAALQDYVRQASALPSWADAALIERAEQLFIDHGVLSCTLLFCASLPECYVLPDLSAVLHATGQLEDRTEHRIRATAAMIFPVMMRGGLTGARGGGIAQVLKVRLIHATVRHLVLRGAPLDGTAQVAPLQTLACTHNMHHALAAHGWDVPAQGLPCNQLELAYTLLTFHYVFLRGLRDLHIPLSAHDERAYLHAWNVMGHVLGIESALMPQTMDAARAAFGQLQAQGRRHEMTARLLTRTDCRPALGQALMACMARVIPLRLLKPVPVLMTRHLCGPATAQDIGLAQQAVPWLSRALFGVALFIARLMDGAARLFWPRFSIARFLTRLVGYRLVCKLLMDQTRPLALPEHLREQMRSTVDGWRDDPHAPAWLNRVEDRLTVRGAWAGPPPG
jgi:hypothetical protein